MKIYFAGSIRAVRDDQGLYQRLIQSLQYHGQVLTEHVGDPNLTQWGGEGPADQDIYERDTAWLADADVIVAEVSTPSLGVGYDLGRAESLKKPTLCLYRERDDRSLSPMVYGNPETMVGGYQTEEEVLTHILTFLRDFAANPR